MADSRKPAPIRVNTPSAVFISVCALVVSVVQTRIARQQQTASVWPRLLAGANVPDRNFYFSLANQGVGPAIVRRVEVEYEGKQPKPLSKFLYRQAGSPKNGGFFRGVHLRAEYADVYGNCWLLDYSDGRNRVTERGKCAD